MRLALAAVAASAGLIVFTASALPGPSGSSGQPPGANPGIHAALALPPEPKPAHPGHELCIHYDLLPVTYFVDDYFDPLSNHYHGWRPPAGPPFYVQCE